MRISIGLASILILGGLLAVGCAGDPAGKDKSAKPKDNDIKQPVNDNADAGPHGGALAKWDGPYRAEFTVEPGKQETRVYILDKDGRTPAAIKAAVVTLTVERPRFEIDLKPERQKGDPEGAASVFVGTHPHLGREWAFEGTLSADIDGKSYSAPFTAQGPK